jgi:type IV pilus assembly protein PilE
MRGVTLVELMIVVVVIGILASIGIPSYRQYVIRATRTEAKTALLRLQAAEEKYYLQKAEYSKNLKDSPPAGLGLSDQSEGGNYDIKVELVNGTQGYVATAKPLDGSGQKKDKQCQSFSIDHTGKRTYESATGATTTQSCWR